MHHALRQHVPFDLARGHARQGGEAEREGERQREQRQREEHHHDRGGHASIVPAGSSGSCSQASSTKCSRL